MPPIHCAHFDRRRNSKTILVKITHSCLAKGSDFKRVLHGAMDCLDGVTLELRLCAHTIVGTTILLAD